MRLNEKVPIILMLCAPILVPMNDKLCPIAALYIGLLGISANPALHLIKTLK